MASLLTSLIGAVLSFVAVPENGLTAAELTPCAEVQTPVSPVTLGSAVTASCRLAHDCPLTQGRDFDLEWHLNDQPLLERALTNQSGMVSNVFIPSFVDTRGYLTCCVRLDTDCLIVGGLEIRAGYPPSAPQNLTCLTNLTFPYTLSCKWDPGTEGLLPTNYTLHTAMRYFEDNSQTYALPAGLHSHTIARLEFPLLSELLLSVSATNALGRASSEVLPLVPLESADFPRPVVLSAQPERYRPGCLRVQWRLVKHLSWVTEEMSAELHYKTRHSQLWASQSHPPDVVQEVVDGSRLVSVEQCNLLHGTEYQVQMRVRYPPGPWSGWSSTVTGSTLEKAPTGRLLAWLKMSREPAESHHTAQLFWKPSQQFRANGKNLSYHVFLKRDRDRESVCTTGGWHCAFRIPRGTKRVFITASNSMGQSNPTAVPVFQHQALDPVLSLSVFPSGDSGLLVKWVGPDSLVAVDYVVEWGPLWTTDTHHISFDVLTGNESSALISGHIEPYMPYKVSVYPRYPHGIGLPQTAEGYSSQKAPSVSPRLKVGDIQHTSAELTWNNIPPEQRHGIIRSYTVYCSDEEGRVQAVRVGPMERRVVLTQLKPLSIYKAHMEVSTDGGSRNGTAVTIKTASEDLWNTLVSVVLACLGLMLPASLAMLLCFRKHKRLKMHLWPIIPDPANSSIKNWTEAGILEDKHAFQDIKDPTPVNLSRFSLLEEPEKFTEKGGGQTEQGCQESETNDPKEPHGGSCPLSMDSVPYATVLFSCPYRSQGKVKHPVYLRSESTRPLLEDEPPSPTSPQVAHPQETVEDQGFFTCSQADTQGKRGSRAFWAHFPLLSALQIGDIQNEV